MSKLWSKERFIGETPISDISKYLSLAKEKIADLPEPNKTQAEALIAYIEKSNLFYIEKTSNRLLSNLKKPFKSLSQKEKYDPELSQNKLNIAVRALIDLIDEEPVSDVQNKVKSACEYARYVQYLHASKSHYFGTGKLEQLMGIKPEPAANEPTNVINLYIKEHGSNENQ